jgi:hypothetical protein
MGYDALMVEDFCPRYFLYLYLPSADMSNKINFRNFVLIIILQCALLSVIVGEQIITNPFAYSASNNTQSLRLNGPINSLQYASDGNVLWIVSGRWRMDADFDNTGVIPMTVKNFNVTLIGASADGSNTQRYQLSDFKQDSISYDNKTKTSSIKGKLTMTSDEQSIKDIAVLLKLINKNILTITLDSSKTREQLGETPIYGIER